MNNTRMGLFQVTGCSHELESHYSPFIACYERFLLRLTFGTSGLRYLRTLAQTRGSLTSSGYTYSCTESWRLMRLFAARWIDYRSFREWETASPPKYLMQIIHGHAGDTFSFQEGRSFLFESEHICICNGLTARKHKNLVICFVFKVSCQKGDMPCNGRPLAKAWGVISDQLFDVTSFLSINYDITCRLSTLDGLSLAP
jgi:hypothetical protein